MNRQFDLVKRLILKASSKDLLWRRFGPQALQPPTQNRIQTPVNMSRISANRYDYHTKLAFLYPIFGDPQTVHSLKWRKNIDRLGVPKDPIE